MNLSPKLVTVTCDLSQNEARWGYKIVSISMTDPFPGCKILKNVTAKWHHTYHKMRPICLKYQWRFLSSVTHNLIWVKSHQKDDLLYSVQIWKR